MIKRRTSPGNKLWWIDPTYGLTECLVIEIVRGCIEVSVPRYKCHVPLKPKDLFENEEEALLVALDRLDSEIVLETNDIKQHNENIVELTAKKEGLMKAYKERHKL